MNRRRFLQLMVASLGVAPWAFGGTATRNNYRFQVTSGGNLLTATRTYLPVALRRFSQGLLVVAVNYQGGNWQYRINGVWRREPVDQCNLVPGDVVEWLPV
ncbi:MAG: hypothetical protein PHW95_04910 [Patescibacteria group bacterium]|nr:hypothetical protein [Patescibacteria group bacterium]